MLRQSRKRYESRQVHSAASRSVLVPAVPEAFVYDADGNLLRDGLWIYEWDADGARQRGDGAPKARPQGCRVRVPLGWTRQQNRLIAQELRSDVSTATWKRLEYKYDREGRRVQKLVKTRSTVGGSWTTASDTRFLYDGWNLIAEYSYTGSTFTLLRSHVWGLDLSGTPQGAGGVGGLLWTTVAATSKTYIAAADANGNVIAYVDSADGIVAGKRDYGAFGEAVITTGVAGSLPFGFSSKYEEKESGLYYYGMRFYAPSTGRWPNRDPIGERGGLNLYGMAENNPVNKWDYIGMLTLPAPAKVESLKVFGRGYFRYEDGASLGQWWRRVGVDMELILKPCYTKEMVVIKQEARVIIRQDKAPFFPGTWKPDSDNLDGIWWDGADWLDLGGLEIRGVGRTRDGTYLQPHWSKVFSRSSHPREIARFYDSPGFSAKPVSSGYPLTYIMRARTWVEDIKTKTLLAEKHWHVWFQLSDVDSGSGGFSLE